MDVFGLWLRLTSPLVPSERRREWRAEWRAEMGALSSEGGGRFARLHAASGALPDALWHFFDEWSFDTMWNDIRHALRALRHRVSVTFLAVLVLGLGLGASVAVVSAVDAVLLRPLPFDEPDRLVQLWEQNPTKGWHRNWVAPANFFDWRESMTEPSGSGHFDDMALYSDWSESWRILQLDGATPQPVDAVSVGPHFFDVLRVSMHLGSDFDEDDLWRRAERRAILSHHLWTRSFGGDPSVLGRLIKMEGREVRVHGIAPPGFEFPRRADLWTPMGWDESETQEVWFRRAHFLRVVGRLADGVTLDQARAELAAVAKRLEAEYPETNTDMGSGITPLHEWLVGDTRRPLTLVASAVGLLLLVACANVASLMLLRAGSRGREMAVRSALGAGRRRLVRLLAMEGVLLATAACLLAYLFARFTVGALRSLSLDVPRLDQAALEPRILVAGLVIALGSTLIFCLAPALLGTRVDLRTALHGGSGRQSDGQGQVRARKALVVAEVALATVLVVSAGLFVRSLSGLYDVDPGFDTEGVLSVRLNVPGVRYQEPAQVQALYDRISDRARSLPGVVAVGLSRTLPLGGGTWTSDYSLQGLDEYGLETQHLEIDEGFADAVGLRLLAGRHLNAADRDDAEPVVLVSRELVGRMLPGSELREILGRRFCSSKQCTEENRPKTIVGVVEDIRFDGLAEPLRPMVYHSLRQRPQMDRELFLRADVDTELLTASLAGPLQAVIREVDAGLPLMKVRTLRQVVDESLARERFLTSLLAGFGTLALLLALVGTYGVLATTVQLRRRELGIRSALGAGRRELLGWVMRQGFFLLMLGAALGLGLTALTSRWTESLLFAVPGRDPLTYAVATLVLIATGLLATWLPARRASRVDPVTVLRAD